MVSSWDGLTVEGSTATCGRGLVPGPATHCKLAGRDATTTAKGLACESLVRSTRGTRTPRGNRVDQPREMRSHTA